MTIAGQFLWRFVLDHIWNTGRIDPTVNEFPEIWFEIFLSPENAAPVHRELAFIERHFPLARFPRLIDVPCGIGRHAGPLAKERGERAGRLVRTTRTWLGSRLWVELEYSPADRKDAHEWELYSPDGFQRIRSRCWPGCSHPLRVVRFGCCAYCGSPAHAVPSRTFQPKEMTKGTAAGTPPRRRRSRGACVRNP
jgi:hypothetical protein